VQGSYSTASRPKNASATSPIPDTLQSERITL